VRCGESVERCYKLAYHFSKRETIMHAEKQKFRYLQIEPTTRCNFSCKFCAGRSMEQRDMEVGLFERILSDFPEVEHIELQGEGEPLLHPDFFQMADMAKRKGIKVSLISNGSMFNTENINRILGIPLDHIMVSIESVKEEKFRELRGGSLPKVESGLKALMEARAGRNVAHPAVGLVVTVLKDTLAELPDIAAFYTRLSLDGGIMAQPLQRRDTYMKNYAADIRENTLDEDQEVEIIASTMKTFSILNLPEFRRIHDTQSKVQSFYDIVLGKGRLGGRTCPFLSDSAYINCHGIVTACCLIKDTQKFALGKVGRDEYSQIVHAYEAMKNQLGNGTVPEACLGCKLIEQKKLSPKTILAFAKVFYEQRYACAFGRFRLPLITRAASVFRLCGDWSRGIARIHCPKCGYDVFRPFSYKSFILCPSCAQKRTLLLGEYLRENLLLRLPHRQYVWTIPRVLRGYLRHHRELFSELGRLLFELLSQYFSQAAGRKIRTAMVSSPPDLRGVRLMASPLALHSPGRRIRPPGPLFLHSHRRGSRAM
jgi:MoaA/NifB/PqqE/SkfB family radical SAM enzyme